MQSPIKQFQAPTTKAPWIGKSLLEKAKTAGIKPAAATKANK